MNGLDIVVVGAALLWVVIGYRQGFVKQLISVVGLIAAYVAAFLFYDDIAGWLAHWEVLAQWEETDYAFLTRILHLERYIYNVLGFAIVFFAAKLAFRTIGSLLGIVTLVPGIRGANKFAGALLAMLECLVVTTLLLHVLSVLPHERPQGWLDDSRTAPFFLEHIPLWANQLHDLWDQK